MSLPKNARPAPRVWTAEKEIPAYTYDEPDVCTQKARQEAYWKLVAKLPVGDFIVEERISRRRVGTFIVFTAREARQ